MNDTTLQPARPAPSAWRAWTALVRVSVQRQARAHLMVWIALGLLAFTLFLVGINTQAGRWSMAHWTWPRFKGPSFAQHHLNVTLAASMPWQGPDGAVPAAA